MIRIAPSILSADFSNLADEVRDVSRAGADWLHVDVMDGNFVPNISIGIPVLQSLRKITDLFLDVHLMIDRPLRYVQAFCQAGADLVSLHLEADTSENIGEALALIKLEGKKAGLVLKPNTPALAASPWLPELDLVLVMTVEPGFGGQRFMTNQLAKIATLREMIDKGNFHCLLQVDGGVNSLTSPFIRHAGADVLVAGSSIFGSQDRAKAIADIRGEQTVLRR